MPPIPASVQAESQSLTPTARLTLFTLDLTPINDPVQYYFVSDTNALYQNIVFNGQTYQAFPITLKDAGYDGQGSIVRPKLQVSNINGFVSNLLLQQQDLVGATVTWQYVFARFIDAVNWPGGVSPYTPDTTAAYAPETLYINRKTQENQQIVEWELTPSFDLTARRVPSRQMLANICSIRYRDPLTCTYASIPVADINGNLFTGPPYNITLNSRGTWSNASTYNRGDYVTRFSTNQSLLNIPLVFVCLTNGTAGSANDPLNAAASTNWVQDACPKTCVGCRLRFPFPAALPFGGFPGLARTQYIAGYSSTNA